MSFIELLSIYWLFILGVSMLKSLTLLLLILPLTPMIYADEVATPEPEEEWLITDRDNGSRERPNLFDYNRENVRYNNRPDSNPNSNAFELRDSDYNPHSQNTFNRQSNYQESSNDYYNR